MADTTLTPFFFRAVFIAGTVIAVSGKPVQLPDDNHIEQALAAVFNHVLKFRAVVRLSGKGSINVVAQNGDTVLLGKGSTLHLSFPWCFLPVGVGGSVGLGPKLLWWPPTKQRRFLSTSHGWGIGVKTHFNETAHFFPFRGGFGLKCVGDPLWLVRAGKDIIQRHIKVIRIAAKQRHGRGRLAILIAIDAGLCGA